MSAVILRKILLDSNVIPWHRVVTVAIIKFDMCRSIVVVNGQDTTIIITVGIGGIGVIIDSLCGDLHIDFELTILDASYVKKNPGNPIR